MCTSPSIDVMWFLAGYYDSYQQQQQQQVIGSGFDDLLQFPGNPPEVHEEKVAAALVKNFEFLQKIDLVNAGLLSADEIKKNKAPVIVMSSYITTLLDHIY